MDHFDQSRRRFFRNTATGTALLATTPFTILETSAASVGNTGPGKLPWYKTVTRWGQINITEKDPEQYDIGWWRQFWKANQTQGVIINAGGIVAYYPTKIPYHHKATYLGNRDLFGELCKAAHDDGLAVFARMDSNRANEEFYNAHPDWFALNAQNKPYRADDLYITCVNSPYYQEHIPAILTEIVQLYKPEGFTDNSWSGLGRNSICYCTYCKKSFHDKTGHDIPLKKDWDDEVKALVAEAGQITVVAKRKGDNWFVGGITNGKETTRNVEPNSDFLPNGKNYPMTYFEDGINAGRQAMDYRRKTAQVKAAEKMTIKMVSNGGFAVSLK
jgi:hypothetical protein